MDQLSTLCGRPTGEIFGLIECNDFRCLIPASAFMNGRRKDSRRSSRTPRHAIYLLGVTAADTLQRRWSRASRHRLLAFLKDITGCHGGSLLRSGILNPAVNSLLSRVRHTNTLVIADRGFPSWPHVETVDISLVDDIPRVLDVLRAVLATFECGRAYMAAEFEQYNSAAVLHGLREVLGDIEVVRLPHAEFKKLVPLATGLIRTGDTIQYANIILESA